MTAEVTLQQINRAAVIVVCCQQGQGVLLWRIMAVAFDVVRDCLGQAQWRGFPSVVINRLNVLFFPGVCQQDSEHLAEIVVIHGDPTLGRSAQQRHSVFPQQRPVACGPGQTEDIGHDDIRLDIIGA